jgi:hypothetical protein
MCVYMYYLNSWFVGSLAGGRSHAHTHPLNSLPPKTTKPTNQPTNKPPIHRWSPSATGRVSAHRRHSTAVGDRSIWAPVSVSESVVLSVFCFVLCLSVAVAIWMCVRVKGVVGKPVLFCVQNGWRMD